MSGGRSLLLGTFWTASRRHFGISPEFWLNLQTNYDLIRYRPKRQVARIAVAV